MTRGIMILLRSRASTALTVACIFLLGLLVGIISIGDIVKHLSNEREAEVRYLEGGSP